MRKIKNFLIITGIMIILAGMMGCSVMMAPAFSGCSKEETVVEEKDTQEEKEQIEEKDEEIQAITGNIGNLDELIEKACREPNPEEREKLYLEIQNIVIENALTIPLYNSTGFHVEREWVKGWYPHPLRSGDDYYQLRKKEINTSNKVKNPDMFINLKIGEPSTLDPHWMYDTASGEIVLNCYDNLIRYDGESLTDFLPMVSTEVPSEQNGLIKNNGTKYIFPIKEGITFHSGNTLTPNDVEYSFERGIIQDRVGGPQWMIIEALSGGEYTSVEDWFEAYSGVSFSSAVSGKQQKLIDFFNDIIDPLVEVSENTIIFNLEGAYAPFLSIICHYSGWTAIVDSKWMKDNGAWDGNADGWWNWHNPEQEDTILHNQDAGSGPFKVVEWNSTEQKVTLERFNDYWRGPADIKEVIIWGINEYSTRKAMLESGEADIVYIPGQYRDQVIDLPGVRVIEGYPLAQTTTFFMNQQVSEDSEYIGSGKLDGEGIPPNFFEDIHVRKAFRHCYNAQVLINEVGGEPIPTDLPIGYLGYSEELPLPEFSMKKATEEFKKAFDGELWEKGFKLTLLYNTGNEARQTAAEMFKFYIESLNPKFRIDVQGVQWPTYLKAQRAGYMPAFIIGWLADYPDPHNFLATYYASYGIYASRQGEPFLEFARANVDELITAAVKETDPAKREELYIEVQKIAIENTLGVPLYMPLGFHVERDWVRGWYPHPLRSGTNYYEVYKEQ